MDKSRFPEITVRFTIVDAQGEPAKDLPEEEIAVYEDRKKVHSLRPKGLRSEPMIIALAIDTSGSMNRQEKMPEAKRAAERFFDRLDQDAPCGLVLFHHSVWEAQPVGLNKGQLRQAVRDVEARGGTAYFDGAAAAIDLVSRADYPGQRAVVIMTDGRDVNSRWTLDAVVEKAKANKVRLYTLGLGEPGRNERLRTVLVLDRSGSMSEGNKIAGLKRAASRFIQLMPREASDTTIIAFNDRVPRAGPFTGDKAALLNEIAQLHPAGETALFDATYEALETLIASRRGEEFRGRQAVVVLTDGKDEPGSRRRYDEVIKRANSAELKVHMLGFGEKDLMDEKVMKIIAEGTGGKYFYAQNEERLTSIFEELSIDLHDEGIDERSLKALAERTGGQYYHAREGDQLTGVFERVASQLDASYVVTFRSQRDFHDGTARGIEIRFGDLGDLAVGETAYVTHGLIAATGGDFDQVYLTFLVVLVLLLSVPAVFRRATRPPERAAS